MSRSDVRRSRRRRQRVALAVALALAVLLALGVTAYFALRDSPAPVAQLAWP